MQNESDGWTVDVFTHLFFVGYVLYSPTRFLFKRLLKRTHLASAAKFLRPSYARMRLCKYYKM